MLRCRSPPCAGVRLAAISAALPREMFAASAQLTASITAKAATIAMSAFFVIVITVIPPIVRSARVVDEENIALIFKQKTGRYVKKILTGRADEAELLQPAIRDRARRRAERAEHGRVRAARRRRFDRDLDSIAHFVRDPSA